MNILILTKDQNTGQRLGTRFDIQGHESELCDDWDVATDKLKNNRYHIVFLGRDFLTNKGRNVSLIRNNSIGHVYIVGVGVENYDDDLKLGLNNIIPDNISDGDMDSLANLAVDFILKLEKLGNDSEDFPSSGGVISKSAFNQLFLSALDRTGRYAESSYVLFFSVENYNNIVLENGNDSALHASARLGHHLSKTRRQSDILGQISDSEYAILFLRPEYKEEPFDATNRFFETLSRIRDYVFSSGSVDISLKLMMLPSGSIDMEHSFSVTPG